MKQPDDLTKKLHREPKPPAPLTPALALTLMGTRWMTSFATPCQSRGAGFACTEQPMEAR